MEKSKTQFVAIPGFKKYEFDGKTVRNAKTGKVLSLSSGRNSFQMLDDKGSNRSLTLEKIKSLVPAVESKKKTRSVASKEPQRLKFKPEDIDSKKVIATGDLSLTVKICLLDYCGYDRKSINTALKTVHANGLLYHCTKTYPHLYNRSINKYAEIQ